MRPIFGWIAVCAAAAGCGDARSISTEQPLSKTSATVSPSQPVRPSPMVAHVQILQVSPEMSKILDHDENAGSLQPAGQRSPGLRRAQASILDANSQTLQLLAKNEALTHVLAAETIAVAGPTASFNNSQCEIFDHTPGPPTKAPANRDSALLLGHLTSAKKVDGSVLFTLSCRLISQARQEDFPIEASGRLKPGQTLVQRAWHARGNHASDLETIVLLRLESIEALDVANVSCIEPKTEIRFGRPPSEHELQFMAHFQILEISPQVSEKLESTGHTQELKPLFTNPNGLVTQQFAILAPGSPLLAALAQAKQDGSIKVVVAPSIVTTSGVPMMFHSGGEVYFTQGTPNILRKRAVGTIVDLVATSKGDQKVQLELFCRYYTLKVASRFEFDFRVGEVPTGHTLVVRCQDRRNRDDNGKIPFGGMAARETLTENETFTLVRLDPVEKTESAKSP